MATVTPPPPPSAPAPPTTAPPTVVVTQPPPALVSLDIGARLDALIVGVDGRGQVLVKTPLGQLALQTNISLPSSGPIQLQVQSLGTQVFLLITAIHGKAPASALRALSGLLPPTLTGLGANSTSPQHGPAGGNAATNPISSGTAASANTRTQATTTPVNLTQGSVLNATFLKPTAVIFGNLQAAHSQGASTQITAPGATAPASMATAVAGGSTQAAATANQAIAPAGSTLAVRIISIQPSAAAQPSTASAGSPLSLGSTLSGVVTAQSGSGNHSVIQTHAGPISLATAATLPTGTMVELEITQLSRPISPQQNMAMIQRLGQVISDTRQWPALEETLQTLSESHPATAQQMINAVMPRADSGLTANLLFFLFALRGGEVRQWLGDAPARALERLKPALLGRLRDDFSGLSRVAEEPISSDGRVMAVPFANGATIEQIRLWLQRRDEEEPDEEDVRKGPGTRFVVDVNLSQLGRMQLDGYVQDGTKRFDLIIRTDQRLPDEVQIGIRAIFEEATITSGTTGGLGFQSAPANFVDTAVKKIDDPSLGLMV
jgi:hypothetical protein